MSDAAERRTAVSIMQRLRDETHAQHAYAEQRPLEQDLLSGRLSRETYGAYLAQRWLIYTALEPAVRALCECDARLGGLMQAEQYQVANLGADLRTLGVETTTVRPLAGAERLIAAIVQFAATTPAAVLGCLYVFEGSKNGAAYIAKRLRGAYGLDGDGLRYLDPHGMQQRPIWMSFKERMNSVPLVAEESDAMVAAARLTFDAVAQLDDELYARGAGAIAECGDRGVVRARSGAADPVR